MQFLILRTDVDFYFADRRRSSVARAALEVPMSRIHRELSSDAQAPALERFCVPQPALARRVWWPPRALGPQYERLRSETSAHIWSLRRFLVNRLFLPRPVRLLPVQPTPCDRPHLISVPIQSITDRSDHALTKP